MTSARHHLYTLPEESYVGDFEEFFVGVDSVIALLPDPRAVALLKALAPSIADMHRRLTRLEALHRAGRLTRRATR